MWSNYNEFMSSYPKNTVPLAMWYASEYPEFYDEMEAQLYTLLQSWAARHPDHPTIEDVALQFNYVGPIVWTK